MYQNEPRQKMTLHIPIKMFEELEKAASESQCKPHTLVKSLIKDLLWDRHLQKFPMAALF